MDNWKQHLRFDELEAQVSLNFLQQNSPVRLAFGEYSNMQTLTPEAEAAVDAVLQRLPDLEKLVSETAFEHYRTIRKEFSRIYGEQVEIPIAKDSLDLHRLYQLQTIYFPEEPEVGRFGLGFKCEWEIEHGFGLQFRNWQIVEIGGEAEAFSFYD